THLETKGAYGLTIHVGKGLTADQAAAKARQMVNRYLKDLQKLQRAYMRIMPADPLTTMIQDAYAEMGKPLSALRDGIEYMALPLVAAAGAPLSDDELAKIGQDAYEKARGQGLSDWDAVEAADRAVEQARKAAASRSSAGALMDITTMRSTIRIA